MLSHFFLLSEPFATQVILVFFLWLFAMAAYWIGYDKGMRQGRIDLAKDYLARSEKARELTEMLEESINRLPSEDRARLLQENFKIAQERLFTKLDKIASDLKNQEKPEDDTHAE